MIRNKKQTNARKKIYQGIEFESELEVFMYKLLKQHRIPFDYESQRFEIDPPFVSPNASFERFMNNKGDFKDRGSGKNYEGSMYTPDFTPPVGKPLKWVIEVKGRVFPDFRRTWRLFKKLLLEEQLTDTVLFVPRNEKDCLKVIEVIKKL